VPAALLWIDSMMATIFDPQAPPPDYQERARVALAFRPAVLSANAEDLAGLYGFVAAQSRRYGAIRTPTVIVSGDADKVVWTNLHSRFLARDIPGARLVLLPGVGHMPHHFAPDRVAGEIETMEAARWIPRRSPPAAPWSRPEPSPAATIDLPALLRISATKDSLRGPDPSTGDAVVLPVTVALLTSAAARAGDGAAVRQLADELLALRSEPGPGWGIGFPSDAFGDGSVNPANTIYGLVTAFAAGALLDAFEASGEPRYRDAAIEALDHYAAFAVRDRDGVFMAHSDQPSDRIAVYANSALLMGEYARAGAVTGREDFAALADALFRSLRAARLDTPLGPAWPYSFTNPS